MRCIYDEQKKLNPSTYWILDGWAKSSNKNIDFVELRQFENQYHATANKEICLLMGSQRTYEATHKVIDHCREKGIYSIFVFDHWGNYAKHFRLTDHLHLPDKICVPDETAKSSLVSALNPYLDDKTHISKNIVIVGHPAIEESVRKIQNISEEEKTEIRSRLNAANKRIFLFLTEPIEEDFGYDSNGVPNLGYTEYSIITYFFNNYARDDVKVVIRPHPRQNTDKICEMLAEKVGVSKADYVVTDRFSLEEMIAVCDEVFGITTLALITAAKAGKKIKSLQVGRREKKGDLPDGVFENNMVL